MTATVKTIQVEVMLAGWSDSHQGGAKLTFWLTDDADLEHFRMATVRKGKTAGQRYYMVLAEIEDDETVKDQPSRKASSDAHLMVTGPQFVDYVRQTIKNAADWTPDRVRNWVKWSIGVESLSELDRDPAKLKAFHDIIRRPFAAFSAASGGPDSGERFGDDDPGTVSMDETS